MFDLQQLELGLPPMSVAPSPVPDTTPNAVKPASGSGDYASIVGDVTGLDGLNTAGTRAPYVCSAAIERLDSVDDLPRKLRKWVRVMIVKGYDKAAPDRDIVKGYNDERAKRGEPSTDKPYPSRSEATFAVIGYCKYAGVSDGVLLNILTDQRWGISAHCRDNGGDDYARKQIAKWRNDPQTTFTERKADAKADIPADAIIVEGGTLLSIIEVAERLLIDNHAAIYQRGTTLVHPVRLDQKQADQMTQRDGVERRPGALVLLEVTRLGIVRMLAEHGTWYGRVYGELVPTDPPEVAASHILDKKGEWDFEVVKGITPAPTLRRDGTILQTPGHDPASQLIFDAGGVAFPVIPESPTLADAREALKTLLRPVRAFPFVSETDRSIYLAALLTAVVRQALRTAPLFGFDAPAAGTGKSMLCEMIGIILLGDVPPLMNPSQNDEEFSKQLGAVLLRGDPIIWLDNVLRTLGNNETLCSMFTNPHSVSIRVLGQSKMPSCPAYCTVIASGNHLAFSDDMTRRVLKCRLDAGVERPELRRFDFNPLDEVRADRMNQLVAVLTILRAYIVAGRPNMALEPFGSFEDFDLIRGALAWVGMPDPCGNRMEVTGNDESRDYAIEALREWHTLIGESPVTIKGIRAEWLNNPTRFESLVDALKIVTNLDKLPGFDPLRTGQRLKRMNRRIVGGFKLETVGQDRNGVTLWNVTRVDRQLPLPLAATPADPYAGFREAT